MTMQEIAEYIRTIEDNTLLTYCEYGTSKSTEY